MPKFQKHAVVALGRTVTVGDDIVAITVGPKGKRLKTYSLLAIQNVIDTHGNTELKFKALNINRRVCTLTALEFILPLASVK